MKDVKKSLIVNSIVVLLVTIGTILMFFGITFMTKNNLIDSVGFEIFKYFTVDSNILIGFASLLLIIYEVLLLKKKINKIPTSVHVFKGIAIACIALTFVVTIAFVAPKHGYDAMYTNSNLLFHLIIPILSIYSYIFLEKYDNKLIYTLYSLLPILIYSVYYSLNVLTHVAEGNMDQYDFYGFLAGNVNNVYITLPLMFFSTWFISIIINEINKKVLK